MENDYEWSQWKLFYGHLIPGAMFFLYSIWHMVKQSYTCDKLGNRVGSSYPILMHLKSLTNKRIPDNYYRPQNVALFPHDVVIISSVFLIGTICLALGIVGLGGRFKLFNENGTIDNNVINYQHANMIGVYTLHFAITLLCQTRFRLRYEVEKLFHALPFFVEALLFVYHFPDHDFDADSSDFDAHLHHLLLLSILGSAIPLLAQVWKPRDTLLDMVWVVFCLVKAMWYIVIPFILYNHHPIQQKTFWDLDEHKSIMLSTALFIWLFLLAVLINTVIGCVIRLSVIRRSGKHFGNGLDAELEAETNSNSRESNEMETLLDTNHNYGLEHEDGF